MPYEGWLIEQLKDPAEAAAYLEAVLEDGDLAAIMLAIRQVAQAQGGLAMIARNAHLTREATYKMLSKSGNPELRSLSTVLKATGLTNLSKADRETGGLKRRADCAGEQVGPRLRGDDGV